MKLWQRYILVKLTKTFLFFLFSLFTIYVIIDLSAHGVRFFSKASFLEITLYYLHNFLTLLDLFLTLTFLLSVLKCLIDLTSHRELVALQMAGLSKKRLLSPFFLFAGLLALAGFINEQFAAPNAGELSSSFKSTYKSKKKSKLPKNLYSVSFEDGSALVYQSFSKETKELMDVFWIRNPSDIWHMKSFQIDLLEGRFVNHLIRGDNKEFIKKESFLSRPFKELPWNSETALNRFIPYESRPLSTLFSQASGKAADARVIFSHLYYKLLAPLIPFLLLICLCPILIRYDRKRPIFLTTALSIFGLLGLKSILDGMLILGENQVLPSYVAIFSPILILLSTTMPSFVKMR